MISHLFAPFSGLRQVSVEPGLRGAQLEAVESLPYLKTVRIRMSPKTIRESDARPLYGMIGVSPVRAFRTPDGGFRFRANEAAVFTDLASGDVLDTWANPYLDGERQNVWHLRNGPLNV